MKDAQTLVIKHSSQQARDIRSFDMMLEDAREADALSLSFIIIKLNYCKMLEI